MAEKILIIDDDIDTLKLVGLMLERQGYDIAVASNGTLGLSKAASEHPDLILLDVMMPDLDGYEVTRRLRSEYSLAHIPIIMFTAKTMVDDKVAGFEAGVDDYLTKPTHPAELTAHVKAVLARTAQARAEPSEKARTIAFLGARGGLGTTTLALNVSIALQHRGHDVLLAEFCPGQGTIALDLNVNDPMGLSNLLSRSLKDIHLRSVDTEIFNHKTGLRILLSSSRPRDVELEQAIPQMETVVNNLTAMCTTVVLDLGSGLRPHSHALLTHCDRIILVVEPVYPTNIIGRTLVEELETRGIGRHKINLALVTKERTSLQIPWQQVANDLGLELAGMISPAPEQAHQASQTGTPLIVLHPAGLVSDQIHKMADLIATFLLPVQGRTHL
jgi:DNA-binding response OmpR family regulator